jgi:hypothetical protein
VQHNQGVFHENILIVTFQPATIWLSPKPWDGEPSFHSPGFNKVTNLHFEDNTSVFNFPLLILGTPDSCAELLAQGNAEKSDYCLAIMDHVQHRRRRHQSSS